MLIQGCASNLMSKSKSTVIEPPADDLATVVFMRSSIVNAITSVDLFEIENGELKFIGALANASKVAHKTTPGRKVYMAYGTAADFMIANVEKNKTYFSIVRPNYATGGFAPTPIRKQGPSSYNMETPSFVKWKKNTTLLVKKPEADKWFADNKDRYLKIYQRYWAKFQTKTEAQKNERTLNPKDGV